MRAIVQRGYGSVDHLTLGEIARPEPAEDEVLVHVRAGSVHPDVWHVVAGPPAVLRLMGPGFDALESECQGRTSPGWWTPSAAR